MFGVANKSKIEAGNFERKNEDKDSVPIFQYAITFSALYLALSGNGIFEDRKNPTKTKHFERERPALGRQETMTVTINEVRSFFETNYSRYILRSDLEQLHRKIGYDYEKVEEDNFEFVNKIIHNHDGDLEMKCLHDLQEDIYYDFLGKRYKVCKICGRLADANEMHSFIDTEENEVFEDFVCSECKVDASNYEPVALLKDEYMQDDQKNAPIPKCYYRRYFMVPSPSIRKIAYVRKYGNEKRGFESVEFGSIDTNHPERYNCDITVLKEATIAIKTEHDFFETTALYVPARDKLVNAVFDGKTYQLFEENAKRYCKEINGIYYSIIDYLQNTEHRARQTENLVERLARHSEKIHEFIPSSKQLSLCAEDIIDTEKGSYIRADQVLSYLNSMLLQECKK